MTLLKKNRVGFHPQISFSWHGVFKLTHFALLARSWNSSKDQYNLNSHGLHSSMEANDETWIAASSIKGQMLYGFRRRLNLLSSNPSS